LEGHKLKIVPLPLPRAVVFEGRRLPASYANFYVANHLVLVPTFNDPNDRIALNTFACVFPGREVVGIYCGFFIWGLGAIHCMTKQQPECQKFPRHPFRKKKLPGPLVRAILLRRWARDPLYASLRR